MLHIRKQEIGDISNSTVIAINGDVTIDVVVDAPEDIVKEEQ